MVYVCDAVMGSGKSQSAINYMNEHPDNKFIYVTPFLDETKRIKKDCPDLRFVLPNNFSVEGTHRKIDHAAELIKNGRNIACSHELFKAYTEDMLNDIRSQEYTMIIDENMDWVRSYECAEDDVNLLIQSGYLKNEDGKYTLTDKEYNGNWAKPFLVFLKNHEVNMYGSEADKTIYYWLLSPNLIQSFKNVFVLTYLFKYQGLFLMFEIHNIEYKNIGVRCFNNQYSFTINPALSNFL